MDELEASIYLLTGGKTVDDALRSLSVPQLVSAIGDNATVARTFGITRDTAQRWRSGKQGPAGRRGGRSRLETAVLTQYGEMGTFGLLTPEQRRSMLDKQVRANSRKSGSTTLSLAGDWKIADSSETRGTRAVRATVSNLALRRSVDAFAAGRFGRLSEARAGKDGANLVQTFYRSFSDEIGLPVEVEGIASFEVEKTRAPRRRK